MVRACYEKRGGKEVQRKSKAEERMDSESRCQRERTIEGGSHCAFAPHKVGQR